VEARIDSSDAYRYTAALAAEAAHPTVFGFYKKVGVLGTAEPVTSAHLGTADNGLSMPGIAWGNGAFSAAANPGPAVTLACGTCHNPHGNGQYRILNPLPDPVTGAIVAVSPFATATLVTDAPLPPPGDARNYTVIQYDTVDGDRLLLASELAARAAAPATAADYDPATAGDYWHQVVPYNSGVSDSANTNHDAPNGQPLYYNGQINAWCAVCHSRYTQSTQLTQAAGVPVPGSPEIAGNVRTRVCVLDAGGACTYPTNGQPMVTGTGDGIYDFRHTTSRNRACTTCHVAHGSNALMAGGAFSSTVPYPNGDPSPSSRLLKVDYRGTCQLCHDPTDTTLVGDETGTTPRVP
jgi:cytochrome c553